MVPSLVKVSVAVIATALIVAAVTFATPATPETPKAISTVMVAGDDGHGSGVHIGRGFIVTAWHVVEGKESMTIRDSAGHEQPGTILWANKAYDLALIRVDKYADISVSRLACDGRLSIGTTVQAVGNPLSLQFIHTWGHVASEIETRDRWKASYIADMTVAPGMSGGPVLDKEGRVVGITVGLSVLSSMMSASPLAIAYIVPSSAVCTLLAK